MKRNLLAGVIAAISASGAFAGESVFYITEQGKPVDTLSVTVNGDRKLVGKNGVVSFDLKGGKHQVELSEFGEWAGEFEFDASSDQNAEIKIEMIGGEAIPDISVYTPGKEAVAVLGQISGYIESDETGGGVEGARISVDGSDVSVSTNGEGYFELELPRGEYDLRIAHPSYGNRDVKGMRVFGNSATAMNVNMSLSGDSAIEEVVAVGSYIPSTATSQQRDSSAVLSAIGSEQMSRFGDSNAASALKRVAGVSIQDEFAVIRGMSGRYISTTLNGAMMPSTDPLRRDVPLDLFPAAILGGIDIQKSFTPDKPGDSTGGAVSMNTKGLPDTVGGKISANLGFNSRTTFNDALSYQGGGSDWSGIDDGTRDEPSLISSATNGGLESVSRNLNTGQAINASDEFKHSLAVNTTEVGPDRGFSISYGDVTEGDDLTSGFYAAFQYSDKWDVRHDAILNDVDGVGTYDRSKRKIDVSGYFLYGLDLGNATLNSRSILLRKSDDTTRVTRKLDSDLDSEEYTLQWVERQFLSQQFDGEYYFDLLGQDKLNWNVGLAQTTRYEPDRRSYTYARAIESNNPFRLQGVAERRYSDLTEDALTLGWDYEGEMEVGDMSLLKLKTGFMYANKDRDVSVARYTNTPLVGMDTNLSIDEILSSENINNGDFLYD